MKTTKFLCAAATLLAAVTSIQATVLVGNLPINDLNTSDAISVSSRYAVGFTTGATAQTLDNIKLDLTLSSGTAGLDIRLGNSTTPSGSAFNSFGFPSISGSTYTFAPLSSFTLGAATTYWLVVNGTGTGTWLGNTPNQGYTTTGASYLSTRYSSDGGVNWSLFPSGGNPGLEINATAVPEPREYALLAGFALLGFAVWRRTMAAKTA